VIATAAALTATCLPALLHFRSALLHASDKVGLAITGVPFAGPFLAVALLQHAFGALLVALQGALAAAAVVGVALMVHEIARSLASIVGRVIALLAKALA
jgi:hypothetical protein